LMHADEQQQTHPNLSDHLAIRFHGRARNPLNYGTHPSDDTADAYFEDVRPNMRKIEMTSVKCEILVITAWS
jgi:hypothetical protein